MLKALFSADQMPRLYLLILGILFTVGTVGIAVPVHPYFHLLTPLNLATCAWLLLRSHNGDSDWRFLAALGVAALGGFFVEVIGVATQWPFGEYRYGETLGPHLWDVPVMMAVNWLTSIYCTACVASALVSERLWPLRALIGGALMCLLDVVMEPVAVKLDFWTWAHPNSGLLIAPLQNYVAWFAVSVLIHLVFQKMLPRLQNIVGIGLFVMQFVFFSVLLLLI